MRIITLFSGVGMQEIALKRLGIPYELVYFCEYDKKIAKCFQYIHDEPPEKNLGDITKIDVSTLHVGKIDLLFSSFPCQSFSMAGKKEGFNCPKNGSMFDHSYKIIKKVKPKVVIFENVKNITNKKFNAVPYIQSEMEKLGYTCNHKILNAVDYGGVQNRERWFMVCSSKTFSFPEPFKSDKKVKDYVETNIPRKCSNRLLKYMGNDEYKQIYKSFRGLKKVFDGCSQGYFNNGFTGSRIYSIHGYAPTFTTSNDAHFWELGGKLSAIERWRMMGLSDDDYHLLKSNDVKDSLIHKICGNGIVVNVCEKIFQKMKQDDIL